MRKFDDSMRCLYSSSKDLQDRLHGTICRFNDLPVYVTIKGVKVQLWDIPTRQTLLKEIEPDDPRFDISMLDLGYYNYKASTLSGTKVNKVLFVKRDPSKKYKQGTCYTYLKQFKIDGSPDNDYGASTVLSTGFVDSLTDVFPSIDQVNDGEEYALSQDVAVSRDNLGFLNIYYRCEKIACRTPDGKTHTIKTEYEWVLGRLLSMFGGMNDHAA